MPSWGQLRGQKCLTIKFESEQISITGDYCSKIEEKVRSFALREDEAIRKEVDCQQGEAKRCYRGLVTVVISIITIVLLLVLFGRVDVFIFVLVFCVIAFHKVYVAMYIFSKFCKGVY